MTLIKTIKKSLLWLAIFVVSILIGGGVAVYEIRTWKNSSQVSIAHWQTIGKDKDVNSDELLSIAQIAVYATYPLTKKEVIYLNTSEDSEGNPIDAASEYVIEGKKFDARYWSITAYDQDGFLIPNKLNNYSYNFENIAYNPDGHSFKIHLSAKDKESNWLPITHAKKVSLVIRLYQPSDELLENLNEKTLPIIKKV